MRSKDKSCLSRASSAGGFEAITRDLNKRITEILNSPFGASHYGGPIRGKAKAAKGKGKKRAKRTARKGSWNEARQLHRRLMFRLKKYGSSEAEKVLLRILKDCKRSRRCGSAACGSASCQRCTYAVQGFLAELIGDVLRVGVKLDTCLTIIPHCRIEPSEDTDRGVPAAMGKVERFRTQLDGAFKGSGVSVVIGGVDFTCHEFPDGEYNAHSKPHLHTLVFQNQFKAGERSLRGNFPSKGSVRKPVDIRSYDGSENWLRYMFKYPNRRNIRKKNEEGKWKASSYKNLTVSQHLQQALILHEMGWEGRLYLRGVDLVRGAHGWQFVLTNLMPEVRIRGGKRN